MRVKFARGRQRYFIDKVLEETGCPSLKELINRGIGINYSSLKNYYSERRLLPEWLFEELLGISQMDNNFELEFIDENWGKVKGGKKSKR